MAAPDWSTLRRRVPSPVTAALQRGLALGYLGSPDLDGQLDHALGFVVVGEEGRSAGPASALDLGSGGGLPGLVMAACWPACRITLLEAGERRAGFLRQEVAGIPEFVHVRVIRARAEELGRQPDHREQYDLVSSRSFGPPAVAAECGSAFVAPGGTLVVSEPPAADPEARWPEEGLTRLGLSRGDRVDVGGRFGYQVLRKVSAMADRYPRRTGVPAKRPLF